MGERADEVRRVERPPEDVWGPDPPGFRPSRKPEPWPPPGEIRATPGIVVHTTGEAPRVVGGEPTPEAEAAPETEELRADIQQTRAEMSGTIDAIQERLRPETLAEQAKGAAVEAATGAVESAKEAVRQATIGRAERMVRDVNETARETSGSLMDTIRDNPIPAALAGIGLGWLWMNRRTRPAARRAYVTTRGRHPATGYRWESSPPGEYATRRYAPAETPGGGVDEVVDRAQERAGQVADQARETAGQVASNAGELVSSAGETARGAGSSVWQTIQDNPLAAAVTAAGLVWLLGSRRDESAIDRGYPAYSGYPLYESRGWSQSGSTVSQRQDVAGQVGETVGQAREQVSETIGQAREQVSETVGQAREQAGEVVDQARSRVADAGSEVRYQARRAQSQLDRLLDESPLAVGAVALGLGLAAGLATPGTRQEDELLGQARDRLMDRAQGVIQDTQQRVQQVAQQAQKAASDEARSQNLTQ
jgi:ElaB/YqjD/DUF883 family membrane-anchored ribosome-binding protein